MKRVALGVRMHSGWGVIVAVSSSEGSLEVIDRRRIVTTDPGIPGTKQPYHYAATLALPDSEKHLANCTVASERLALAALDEIVRDLEKRLYRIIGAALLLASGRPLPPLSKILASHPLLHSAEGEFFRNSVRRACERLKISVTTIKERELDERLQTVFGKQASRSTQRRISTLGTSIGPPWTKDHKTAALAASILLRPKRAITSGRAQK
jgi:hypothetical protein